MTTDDTPNDAAQDGADCSGTGASSTMSCLEAVEDLYGYLDGEIDDAKRALIKSHLDDCGHCLHAFEFHDDLQKVVSQRSKTEMPAGLRDKVLAAINDLSEGNA